MKSHAAISALLLSASLELFAGGARAEASTPSSATLGATLGAALPVGSLEAGSRISDTTFATVPFRLDAGVKLDRRLLVFFSMDYAFGIPTLCVTADDCTSSLGTDVLVIVGVRRAFPRLGPVTPELGWGFGYEWFTSRLSDSGVESSRHYRGPALAALELLAHFRLGRALRLAPTLRAVVGEFSHATLSGPGGETSGRVDGLALHGWLSLGARLGYDL